MVELTLSLIVFLGVHALPSTSLRPWLIERLGRPVFMAGFSIVSVILFAWVWIAYRQADIETIFWVTGPLARTISAILILVAVMFTVFAVSQRPSVLLTGETALSQDNAVRGILRITRHPLLWAVGLWGVVHMFNNADPPSWLFFGFSTALAVAGTLAIDRRRKQLLGPLWPAIEATTSNTPFLAILQGRNSLRLSEIGLMQLAIAIAVWALILMLHEPVFGVSPLWF